MSVIALLIAAGGLVAGTFLIAFAWAVRTGQFDDTTTPAVRVLIEDAGRSGPRPPRAPVSPRHEDASDADTR